MPNRYIGIVCDRAKMDRKPYMSRQECDSCVQDPAHPCPFHGKMLKRMWGDNDKEPGATSFSPTRVQGCLRKKWFAAHANEYDELLDPYKAYHAMRGHMVHNFFEQDSTPAPGTLSEIAEVRFQTILNTKYGPVTFEGKPDLIEIKEDLGDVLVVKVVDWKSIRDVKHDFLEAKESHQLQVNMYAWLLWREIPKFLRRRISVVVDELEIVYIDMGKVRRFTTKCDLSDRGKLKIPRRLKEHEPIGLHQMHLAEMPRMEAWIVNAVEQAIEAQTTLYPPLEGDAAKLCDYCSFQQACQQLAQEGR